MKEMYRPTPFSRTPGAMKKSRFKTSRPHRSRLGKLLATTKSSALVD